MTGTTIVSPARIRELEETRDRVVQENAQLRIRIRGYEADMRGTESALRDADKEIATLREQQAVDSQILEERAAAIRLLEELDTLVLFGTLRKKYARQIARDVAVNLIARPEFSWAR